MADKDYKLDIFRTLEHITQKDEKFFTTLSENEKKGFLPIITMRWLSGTIDAGQIYTINEIVNPYVFSLFQHKELLYQLMTSSVPTNKRSRRYVWHKTISKKQTSMPETLAVISEYFGYSKSEARDALTLLSKEDILDYAEQLGKQKDEITKIEKEFKKV